LIATVLFGGCAIALRIPRVPDGHGPAVLTQIEINQLATNIEVFKAAYKVRYIPSQIRLCEFFQHYDQDKQLDRDSIAYLRTLWPQILDPDPREDGQVVWRCQGIDWNGNGKTEHGNVILEGDQCLVFFLGGIPDQGVEPGVLGFAPDDRDPAGLNQRAGRKGPFFEFSPNRLFKRLTTDGGKAGYYSYADPYGTKQPYVYFSCYDKRNGNNSPLTSKYVTPDSTLGVEPYYSSKSPPDFCNPQSYQIISAGLDGQFGPGGLWISAKAEEIARAGRDDKSNFNDGARLGAPNQ
jgi:hypothetical protein